MSHFFQLGEQLLSIPVRFFGQDFSTCINLIEEEKMVPAHRAWNADRNNSVNSNDPGPQALYDYLGSCNLFKRYLLLLVYVCPRMELQQIMHVVQGIEPKKQLQKNDLARFLKEMVIFSRLLSIGKLFLFCSSLILLRKNSSVFARLGSYRETSVEALEALAGHLQNNRGLYSATEMRNWLRHYTRLKNPKQLAEATPEEENLSLHQLINEYAEQKVNDIALESFQQLDIASEPGDGLIINEAESLSLHQLIQEYAELKAKEKAAENIQAESVDVDCDFESEPGQPSEQCYRNELA
jgi:hypothetical protein